MAEKTRERNIITDALVLKQTGKSMEEWFLLLDKKGAQNLSHTEIYTLISGMKGLKPLSEWNQNLLATTYEWKRGLKERGQKENGFEISVSKTVGVPLAVLYKSFANAAQRKKWLQETVTISKATENKSLRMVWEDDITRLSIDFYEKAQDKAQVVVQHLKIPDSKKAATLKDFWTAQLNTLKSLLEK